VLLLNPARPGLTLQDPACNPATGVAGLTLQEVPPAPDTLLATLQQVPKGAAGTRKTLLNPATGAAGTSATLQHPARPLHPRPLHPRPCNTRQEVPPAPLTLQDPATGAKGAQDPQDLKHAS